MIPMARPGIAAATIPSFARALESSSDHDAGWEYTERRETMFIAIYTAMQGGDREKRIHMGRHSQRPYSCRDIADESVE